KCEPRIDEGGNVPHGLFQPLRELNFSNLDLPFMDVGRNVPVLICPALNLLYTKVCAYLFHLFHVASRGGGHPKDQGGFPTCEVTLRQKDVSIVPHTPVAFVDDHQGNVGEIVTSGKDIVLD